MYSDALKAALDEVCVGQAAAVESLVRGVTRVASGMTARDHEFCAYLLMGPTGTGKTHLVRSLARILHGDESTLTVADCGWSNPADPWSSFSAQLAPLDRKSVV